MKLKKIFRTAAASALVLALATGAASAALGTATVTSGPLRMRAEANTGSAVLAKAAKGAAVEVLEDAGNGWYKVSFAGKTGYMSGEYLNITPAAQEIAAAAVPTCEDPPDEAADEVLCEEPAAEEAAPAEEPAAADQGDSEMCGMVTASTLNVRSGAGTGYDKVGSIHSGSIVTVLSQSDGWTLIQTDSVTGYVSNDYLSVGTREELSATATASGAAIIQLAQQYLGTPYKYGGASSSGFDCSGFVYYVYKQAGYSVPRTGSSMWSNYSHVSRENLQPGDVVCFTRTTSSSSYITHVGIYVGNNTFIHSSSPSSGGVIYTSMSDSYYASRYVGAVRLL